MSTPDKPTNRPPHGLHDRTTLPPDSPRPYERSPAEDRPNPASFAPTTPPGSNPAAPPQPAPPDLRPNERIGSYVLRRLIGAGGMGAVFEAEQDNPRRIVALKVLRSGISSRSAQRRFEYEAQLLARLRHPGIAQVYEAGTHTPPPVTIGSHTLPTDPIPFYAMEYVPNAKTVTQFAHDARLSLRDRLALFAKVCDAVHHGHSKGVIHRDLKPANILVDSTGEPKVIDFGVARAVEPDVDNGVHTLPGALIGTPHYMSPEQIAGGASGNPDATDIDTRSDVYALGVVLYELLAGELPYDITRSSIPELSRIIKEQPPKRFDPKTNSQLRGDVETIVLKALEKDRNRRYQSAADLASDLRHYLNNEPIAARPATVSYQLRVMARRNRGLTAGLAVAVLAVIGGIVGVSVFATRESAHRKQAVIARDEARAEAERSQRITKFLCDLLATADPSNAQSKDLTVRELIDIAGSRLDAAFANDPDTAAEVRITLGQTYMQLAQYAAAEGMFRSAHTALVASRGENDPDTLNALSQTAAAAMMQGRSTEAEGIFRDALTRQTAAVGELHADTLSTIANLAMALQDQGKLEESEKLQRKSLAGKLQTLGPAHRETLISQSVLSDLLQNMGKTEEAIKVARESAQACERALGPRHPTTLMAQSILASSLYDVSRYNEAEPLAQNVYKVRVEVLGENHSDTLTSLNIIALNNEQLDRFEIAEPAYRKIVVGARAALGDEHPTTLTYVNNLANCLSRRAAKGKSPVSKDADLDEAEALLRQTLAVHERIDSPDSTATLSAVNNLALLLELRGRFDLAEPLYRRVVAGFERTLPPDHWLRPAAAKNLGDCLVDLGKTDEAETLLLKVYDESAKSLGADNQRTRSVALSLKRLYDKVNKPEQAAKWAELEKAKPEPTTP